MESESLVPDEREAPEVPDLPGDPWWKIVLNHLPAITAFIVALAALLQTIRHGEKIQENKEKIEQVAKDVGESK
jgi:hypothetical protein